MAVLVAQIISRATLPIVFLVVALLVIPPRVYGQECSSDIDCPLRHVCREGRCQPADSQGSEEAKPHEVKERSPSGVRYGLPEPPPRPPPPSRMHLSVSATIARSPLGITAESDGTGWTFEKNGEARARFPLGSPLFLSLGVTYGFSNGYQAARSSVNTHRLSLQAGAGGAFTLEWMSLVVAPEFRIGWLVLFLDNGARELQGDLSAVTVRIDTAFEFELQRGVRVAPVLGVGFDVVSIMKVTGEGYTDVFLRPSFGVRIGVDL